MLSLERGLAVIKSFNAEQPTRTLSEVAQAVGMTRAAARRFLLTLQALGYIEADGRYFRLRPQTLELGYAYLASQPWWRLAQGVVDRLAANLRQACAVGVLDREAVAYVAYAPAAQSPGVLRSIGTRLPAFATAIGRVLLAALPEGDIEAGLRKADLRPLTPFTETNPRNLVDALAHVRSDGYAIVEQELEIGMRSIGVPIFDRSGRVTAAMSVSVRDPYAKARDITKKFLKPLRAASAGITQSLPT